MKINSPKDINYKRMFEASGQSQTSISRELGVGAIMNSQGLHVKGDSELMETSINTVNLIRAISNRSNKSNT